MPLSYVDLSPDLMPAIRHLEFQPRAGLDLFHLKSGADVLLQLRLGEMANPQAFRGYHGLLFVH